ncbi:MAG: peptidase U32 family protein [Aminipila sp.]
MRNIPELLAPVGGMGQLKAAVENGADAVYLGGKLMNARINADNFDDETLKEAVEYAHLRNVKVYITMNVLLKDSELEEALDYAKTLYEIGADAIIVQDLGFASLLQKRLPSMKIHLSTQGTVYNLSGAKAAKALGFERVVLAREVSLHEMKNITKANLIETEVFVHGALCICYSGQCQMSRILGGRSGNRGLCAQPCRLAFDSEDENTHLLSPKDLCAIDYLQELCDAGVSSLKVEGRMKSPEYVAIVTGIYRKYLDKYKEQGEYVVQQEDRIKLEQIFNRGKFTSGYMEGNPGEELMSTELSKHQGVYIGKVIGAAQRSLIDIELEDKLSIGDGIEIRNKNMPGNIVTYLKQLKGNTVRIGDIKGTVFPGDKVYKISDKVLLEEAKKSYEGQSSIEKQGYKKIPVEVIFKAGLGKKAELVLIEGENHVTSQSEQIVEKAVNKPITEELISKQLNKTGDVPFRIENINFDIDDNISMPMSAINQMRREAFDLLIKEKTKGRKLNSQERDLFYQLNKGTDSVDKHNEIYSDRLAEDKGIQLELYFHTITKLTVNSLNQIFTDLCIKDNIEQRKIRNIKMYIPLNTFIERKQKPNLSIDVIINKALSLNENTDNKKIDSDIIEVIPYLPNITKGRYDEFIEENFNRIVSYCKETGIALGNLGWINEFRNAGVKLYADYGLNIYNKESIRLIKNMNFVDYVPSHEVKNNLNNDEDWDKEVMFEGAIPLMVSEHLFGKTGFTDRKNAKYIFIENMFEKKCIIAPEICTVENSIIVKALERKCKKLRVYFP